MSLMNCAVYVERCGSCNHTHASHFEVEDGFLSGRLLKTNPACRAFECQCGRWVSTW